jgi:hypothetical protein
VLLLYRNYPDHKLKNAEINQNEPTIKLFLCWPFGIAQGVLELCEK